MIISFCVDSLAIFNFYVYCQLTCSSLEVKILCVVNIKLGYYWEHFQETVDEEKKSLIEKVRYSNVVKTVM
jgi:hypothetical protein